MGALSAPPVFAERTSVAGRPNVPADETPDRLTARAVAAGLVLVVLVNFAMIYTEYVVSASSTNYSHFPIYTFLTFVLLVLVFSPLLRAVSRGKGLSRGELFAILSMVMVAGLIPSNGLTGFLLVVLGTPFYFADAENRWGEFLHSHIPDWLAPKDTTAMMWFFNGLPPGESIPWSVWVIPLFWWLLLLTAITVATLAIMVILRRQWSEHERLIYPLVQVPIALTQEDAGHPLDGLPPHRHILGRLLRNRLFWAGAAVSFGVLGWNMLNYFIPTVPVIPLKDQWFGIAWGFPAIELRLNFYVLGFAYFANLDVLLSLWLFRVLYIIQEGVYNRLGIDTGGNEDQWSYGLMGWQSFGALAAMVLWGLWVGRTHLAGVFRKAFSRAPDVDDSEEMVGYRGAVWALLLSLLFIVAWLHQAGMELRLILAFLLGTFILYVGIARIVAESGLLYVRGPMSAQVFATYLFGTGAAGLSAASITALGFTYTTISQGKGLYAAGLAQITKMGEFVRGNRRGLLAAVLAAFAVGTLASIVFTLYYGYQYGAYNFDTWHFRWGGVWVFDDTVGKLRNPFPTDWQRISYMGVGAGLLALLTLLRLRLPWWPLHPIGLTVNCTYFTQKTFIAIFIAWAAKTIILRTGGVSLYRRSLPFFIGILVGYVIAVMLSTLLDYFWFFGDGHYIHSV